MAKQTIQLISFSYKHILTHLSHPYNYSTSPTPLLYFHPYTYTPANNNTYSSSPLNVGTYTPPPTHITNIYTNGPIIIKYLQKSEFVEMLFLLCTKIGIFLLEKGDFEFSPQSRPNFPSINSLFLHCFVLRGASDWKIHYFHSKKRELSEFLNFENFVCCFLLLKSEFWWWTSLNSLVSVRCHQKGKTRWSFGFSNLFIFLLVCSCALFLALCFNVDVTISSFLETNIL